MYMLDFIHNINEWESGVIAQPCGADNNYSENNFPDMISSGIDIREWTFLDQALCSSIFFKKEKWHFNVL
jgi:hypothetical protein